MKQKALIVLNGCWDFDDLRCGNLSEVSAEPSCLLCLIPSLERRVQAASFLGQVTEHPVFSPLLARKRGDKRMQSAL